MTAVPIKSILCMTLQEIIRLQKRTKVLHYMNLKILQNTIMTGVYTGLLSTVK